MVRIELFYLLEGVETLQEHLDELRVELLAGLLADGFQHLLLVPGLLVAATAGKRVIDVGKRHDPPEEGNLSPDFAARPAVFVLKTGQRLSRARIDMPRVSLAVPAFMMVQRDDGRRFVEIRVHV